MIHHITLAVKNPLHVAEVVAELWQGHTMPFPAHPDSYIALALDSYGTALEFLPKGTVLKPGLDQDPMQFSDSDTASYTATHVNIAVPISEAQIYAIANREGWRAVRCRRGEFFDLIEFWIENEVLLELLPPTLMKEYFDTVNPDTLQATLNAAIAADNNLQMHQHTR